MVNKKHAQDIQEVIASGQNVYLKASLDIAIQNKSPEIGLFYSSILDLNADQITLFKDLIFETA